MFDGKKLISAAMCTAIGLSSLMVPNVCAADFSGVQSVSTKKETYNDIDNLMYANYGDHVTIIGVMEKTLTEIAIPAEIEGVPVTEIGKNVFLNCQNLELVIIPNTVTTIGDCAFQFCTSLKTVIMFDSIESIGEYAFARCDSLKSIVIPEGVKNIGKWAFERCSALESITILNKECNIDGNAQTICNGYGEEVIVPYFNGKICGYNNSTAQTYAEEYGYSFSSFEVAPVTTTVTTRPTTTTTETTTTTRTTDNNTNTETAPPTTTTVTEVTYPTGNFENLTYINYGDYIGIKSCDKSATTVVIPDEIEGLPVKKIELGAFWDCSALTSITIPDSVETIEGGAFSQCSALTSIVIPDSVKIFKYGALFKGCSSLTSVTLPEGITGIYGGTFEDCSSLTSITIPDSVTIIDDDAFSGCSALTSITIPENVTSIGDDAFFKCSGLKEITIPESVNSIGEWAFYLCSDLESITILNPDCEIYDNETTICNGYDADSKENYFNGTIYGYYNSTAEIYAQKYGYNFSSLGVSEMPVISTESGKKGDLNGDGIINASDASVVLSIYALFSTGGSMEISDEQFNIADVNSDSFIDSKDASDILSYYSYLATLSETDTPLDITEYISG
ncbi:MAG: leucine-rich repeat protein [Ruminococcus sp.]|nr:leucine-rich repeat protein [Ruminococcus sp.]